jgi:hypothetical protein
MIKQANGIEKGFKKIQQPIKTLRTLKTPIKFSFYIN